MQYICDDGNCPVEIPAASAEEAAQEYVDGGGWGDVDVSVTTWVNVYVREAGGDADADADAERIKIQINPDEPPCVSSTGHAWESPIDIVGGCKESPGVQGHGGGVTIHEVCSACGTHRHIDTWAQDPETGEQGLTSISYEDDAS